MKCHIKVFSIGKFLQVQKEKSHMTFNHGFSKLQLQLKNQKQLGHLLVTSFVSVHGIRIHIINELSRLIVFRCFNNDSSTKTYLIYSDLNHVSGVMFTFLTYRVNVSDKKQY